MSETKFSTDRADIQFEFGISGETVTELIIHRAGATEIRETRR